MLSNESRWWMLQVQYHERHPGQLHLLSAPLPRAELLQKSLELIPTSIRALRGDRSWGLADLVKTQKDVFAAETTPWAYS
jgi:hypothetical protein